MILELFRAAINKIKIDMIFANIRNYFSEKDPTLTLEEVQGDYVKMKRKTSRKIDIKQSLNIRCQRLLFTFYYCNLSLNLEHKI